MNIPRFNFAHGIPEMTETGLGYWVKYEDAAEVEFNLRRKLFLATATSSAATFGFVIVVSVYISHIL